MSEVPKEVVVVVAALIAAAASLLGALIAAVVSAFGAKMGSDTQKQLADLQTTTQMQLAKLQQDLDEQKQVRLGELSRRHEIRKPFLEKQMKLYFDAVNLASIIATSGDANERSASGARFFQLYWGELAVVEDDAVARAMVNFSIALGQTHDPANLKVCALALAHKCRESLMKLWDVELGPVTAERNPKV